jgi:hypothetical protein
MKTSSNSDLDDDYQGSTGFIELQGMQHFLHINNYLLDDEPLPDDFIDRFEATSYPGHERDNQALTQHSVCRSLPPVILIVKYCFYSPLKAFVN